MKKTMMAIAAALIMSANVMAQDDNQQDVRRQRGPVDQTEMVKQRTERTVREYGLNEEQAAQLLELNKKYADKMGPRMGQRRGQRMGRPEGRPEGRPTPGERPDSMKREQMPPRHEGMQGNREEFRKTMEAYDAELQKIMTEEQFKAYQADREKQFQGRRRGPGNRQRPERE